MFAAKSNHQNYMLVNCKTWQMVLVSIVINCSNFLFMNGFALRPFDLLANRVPNLDNGVTFSPCRAQLLLRRMKIRCNALRLWASYITP